MMDLRKLIHIVVVSIFALAGISSMLNSLRFAWKLRAITGPYFRSELDLLQGIAFLLAAAGIYRFDPRVRIFALLLAGWTLFGVSAGLLIAPGPITILWFLVWLWVLAWLLSSPVRAQFVALKVESKTA
jgi:hypothetical protein